MVAYKRALGTDVIEKQNGHLQNGRLRAVVAMRELTVFIFYFLNPWRQVHR